MLFHNLFKKILKIIMVSGISLRSFYNVSHVREYLEQTPPSYDNKIIDIVELPLPIIKLNILTSLCEHSLIIKDTFSFAKLISIISQMNQKILVSFDVKSLFTNIPVNFKINLIVNQLFPDSSSRVHGMNKQQFCELINQTCNHTTFQFKGKF